MKCFSIFLLAVLLSLPIVSIGQETDQSKGDKPETSFIKYKNDIGFAGGSSVGTGISYRHWFNNTKLNNFGIQATFGPGLSSSSLHLNSSITFLYRLTQDEHVSLFLYQSNNLVYSQYEDQNYPDSRFARIDRQINNGLGIGVEVVVLKHLSFNVMAGYKASTNFQENSTTLGLSLEGGLFYKF